jgi:uncharacterized RDD family membrane protein YckC
MTSGPTDVGADLESNPASDVTRGPAYGGFWIRLAARLIDIVLIGVPVGILYGIWGWIQYGLLGDSGDSAAHDVASVIGVVGTALVLAGAALYQILLWAKRGATVGQRVFRLKVVDASSGGPITLTTAFARWIGELLDTFFCGVPIGYVWIAFDRRKQAWHDKFAGTVVVREGTGPFVVPVQSGPDRLNEMGWTVFQVFAGILTFGFLILLIFICSPAFAAFIWLQPSGTRRLKMALTVIAVAVQVAFLGWQAVHQGCRLEGTDIQCQTG